MKTLENFLSLKIGTFLSFVCLIFLLFGANSNIFSQDNIELGTLNNLKQSQGGFYDYSEVGKLNMRVSIWGYVRYPGKYKLPSDSNVADLLSYAGGVAPEAYADDLRIYRMMPDSTYTLIHFSYEDLVYKSELNKENKTKIQSLYPGDLIIVPGQPRMYFKDWFSLALSFISTMISLSILLFK